MLHAIDRAVLIFELDGTGRVRSMNARLLGLLGLDAAAVRGCRLVELMADTSEIRNRCVALKASSREGLGWQGVLGCTRANGSPGWLNVYSCSVPGADVNDGRILGLALDATDISTPTLYDLLQRQVLGAAR